MEKIIEFDESEEDQFFPNDVVRVCKKCSGINTQLMNSCGNCGQILSNAKVHRLLKSPMDKNDSDTRYIAFEVSRELLLKNNIPNQHLSKISRNQMLSFCNYLYKAIRDNFDLKEAFYDFFNKKS